ncbi:MAG TPA: EAL domain-containing protein [Elusimicrobiota bacterium]|nr:EAL domain-containing protein [Elusimicrobiota bacterium]
MEIKAAQILKNESVRVYFDPILSVKKKSLIGLSEVGCGVDPETGADIPANALLRLDASPGTRLQMDRLLRKKALETFKGLPGKSSDLLLFVRLDTAIIDSNVVGSGHLSGLVRDLGLDPNNIVIELAASGVPDTSALKEFIQTYRRHGFLIALNEVGSGHSNMNRLMLARPDLLKIGSGLTKNIDRDYYCREIFTALTHLSKKLGALIVATGMEREEEAVSALGLGADMIELGLRLSPDGDPAETRSLLEGTMDRIGAGLKDTLVRKNSDRREQARGHEKLVTEILRGLNKSSREHFDAQLAEVLEKHPSLECAYILDRNGVQVTETVFMKGKTYKKKSLFAPAKRGADHSAKEYFYLLNDAFVNRFTTEPYISLASGSLCLTVSSLFRDAANQEFVFCADIPLESA